MGVDKQPIVEPSLIRGKEVLPIVESTKESLGELKEGLQAGFESIMEVAKSVMDIGGSGKIKDWMEGLAKLGENIPAEMRPKLLTQVLTWMNVVAGFSIAQMGYLRSKLGKKLSAQANDNVAFAKLIAIAKTVPLPPAIEGQRKPRTPEDFIDRLIVKIDGQVTIEALVEKAVTLAEEIKKETAAIASAPASSPASAKEEPKTAAEKERKPTLTADQEKRIDSLKTALAETGTKRDEALKIALKDLNAVGTRPDSAATREEWIKYMNSTFEAALKNANIILALNAQNEFEAKTRA